LERFRRTKDTASFPVDKKKPVTNRVGKYKDSSNQWWHCCDNNPCKENCFASAQLRDKAKKNVMAISSLWIILFKDLNAVES
jgi:hypothetical protein